MSISTTRHWSLLSTYLGPQWRHAILLAVLLFSSIALQLISPQVIRYFIDTAQSGRSDQALLHGLAIQHEQVLDVDQILACNVLERWWHCGRRVRGLRWCRRCRQGVTTLAGHAGFQGYEATLQVFLGFGHHGGEPAGTHPPSAACGRWPDPTGECFGTSRDRRRHTQNLLSQV